MSKAIKCIIAFFFTAILACSCARIDETKFDKVYFESVEQKVAKAEGKPAEGINTEQATAAEPLTGSAVEAKAVTPAAENTLKPPVHRTMRKNSVLSAKKRAVAGAPAARPRKKFRISEMDVASDTMTFNKETSIATFTGSVKLTSKGVVLFSDVLTSKNYKDSAEATGNVRAYYKEQRTTLHCKRMVYGNHMSLVNSYGDVKAEKLLDDGNTVTMYSDEAEFDTESGSITAYKTKKRVKVTLKDIVAFSDKVVYNDENNEIFMTGKPMVKKNGSAFLADKISVNTVTKVMKLENNMWSRLFYGDFQKTKEEADLEANKNPAPGKNIQQKKGGK